MSARTRLLALSFVVGACGHPPTPPAFVVEPPPGRLLVADGSSLCAPMEGGLGCTDGRLLPSTTGWRTIVMPAGELCGVTTLGDLECEHRRLSGAHIAQLAPLGGGVVFADETGAVYRYTSRDERPVGTPHLAGAVMVAGVRGAVCALSRGGRVACLVDDDLAQPPIEIAIDEVVHLSAGSPLCLVRRGGALHCERALGEEDLTFDHFEEVPGLGPVADVVTHDGHVLVRSDTGEVRAFDVPAPDAAWDVGSPILDDTTELAERYGALDCARRRDGEIVCWGVWEGVWPYRSPTAVAGVPNAVDVALSDTHACVATAEGTVLCWGGVGATPLEARAPDLDGLGGAFGASFDGRRPSATFPVESIAPITVDVGVVGVVEIELTTDALCGRSADGAVGCATRSGACGRPPWLPPDVAVAELSGTCARTTDGDVYCRDAGSAAPVLLRTTSIANYYQQVCGVRGRLVACAPTSAAPALDPFVAPTRVRQRFTPAALGPSTRLRGGPTALCGRAPTGAWRCIGHNGVGQLGTTPSRPTIEPVEFGGGAWDDISLGTHRSCVWRMGGVLVCAGVTADGAPRTEADRGDGSLVTLDTIGVVRAVALSDRGAIAVLEDGTVISWGRERWGELGGGRSRWLAEPTPFELER